MSFDYLIGYITSISMCMQNFITIFHSVQEIGPISLFQNLGLDKASTVEKNVISQSLGLDLVNINVYAKVIKIFHSVQEIGLFSLFQNFALGDDSTNDKCHFATSWTRCHFFLFQNIPNGLRVIDIFHEQAGDKIFTNYPATKSNV